MILWLFFLQWTWSTIVYIYIKGFFLETVWLLHRHLYSIYLDIYTISKLQDYELALEGKMPTRQTLKFEKLIRSPSMARFANMVYIQSYLYNVWYYVLTSCYHEGTMYSYI